MQSIRSPLLVLMLVGVCAGVQLAGGRLERDSSLDGRATPADGDTSSADGAASPDENSGRDPDSNILRKAPVVGSQFEVTPVSTAMKCVINLTIQYFLVYTALGLARTAVDTFGGKYDNTPIIGILRTATHTVNYAPMLAILFLGCRMRVLWLSHGKGNPPEWIQMCMYCCCYAVGLMTIAACVVPIFTGKALNIDPKTGELKDGKEAFESPILGICFTVLKYIIMLFLYVGAICVCYGIYTYQPPKGLWPNDEIPPVSPAVACTVILACQYFILYAAVQVSKTVSDFSSGITLSTFENACMTATNAMNFAPMLAVLFIAARMRALQMDPINGSPQSWAQNCFYACTYALMAQVILAVAVPLVINGAKVEKGSMGEGDMVYKVDNQGLGACLTVARYIIMLCIYIGFTCVIYSIFQLEHPKGAEYTPPISVTMQCVINLTVQFFFIYLLIWVCITVDEWFGQKFTVIHQTMENAVQTVMFCPMLAILFVGTRMRALQITKNRGAPQGWVQDGMYMATWAVLIQFFMVCLAGIANREPLACDEDGNVKWEPKNKYLLYCVQAVRWIAVIFMYGGIITVVVGVFTMTPATANGRGAVPLVGDGKVPGTDVGVGVPGTDVGYKGIEEPKGANDIPGVAKGF